MNSLTSYIASGIKAKQTSGKGILSQFVEIAKLWRTPSRLSPSEYYDFQLYDDRKFDWATKKNYLGWRSPIISNLSSAPWHALANDKLIYQGLMSGLGFRVPKIYAIYHKGKRYFGDVPVLNTPQLVADYLRNNCPFPFYGKPVHGAYGEGNVLCTAYDHSSDSLCMASGTTIKVDEFAAGLLSHNQSGYLFQQVLAPAAAMTKLMGNRLSTVRVVVALGKTGPQLVLLEWKIPTGNNIVDNFHGGATGNFIASVSTSTGRIQCVALPDGTISDDPSLSHPDTGIQFVGTEIPDWGAIVELALTAARVFPGLRLQGWDIACTTDGIVPLEVNLVTGRTAYYHQLTMKQGLFNEHVQSAWEAAWV